MSICMAGIDWENANMDKRQVFSFTSSQVSRLCQELAKEENVWGCVLLSTCNRTELYLSGVNLKPAQMLCQAAEIADVENAEKMLTERFDMEAKRHLMAVACGLCSQILGDDQIVSQVKRAYTIAHEAGTTDAELSQLFRLAATAGKRSRTQVHLTAEPVSVAGYAVARLEKAFQSLKGKRALVIGNGEMGRIASALLTAKGCQVTVTLRSYRHGYTIVPDGCQTIAYDERMNMISDCDILLSATTSPHYTVTAENLHGRRHIPQAICDLSMPRDIDPSIRELEGVTFFLDMDSMGGRDRYVDEADRNQVEAIIDEEMIELERWCAYREGLPLMDELCELISERIVKSYDFDILTDGDDSKTAEKMEAAARFAAQKAARLLFGGLQSALHEDALEECKEAILRKAPQLRDRRIQ